MERVTSMAGTMVEEFFPGESMEGEGGDMSLEWLSTFVEDCLSGGFTTPFTIPTTTTTTTTNNNNNNNKKPHQTPTTTHQTPTPPKPPQTEPSLNDPATAIPSRARTKRRKLSSRPNPQAFLPNPSHPTLLPQAYWLADSELLLPKKEQQEERKPAEDKVGKDESPGQARRCSHCLSQKTPQWRAGPLGPKTLCNACGVRFKSGRLLPEYRPAKSPTFVSYKHSNSHKKVMEMRMAK